MITIPVIIFLLSVGIQLTAAVFALRLIRVTGRKLAWILLSLAMVLMAARRATSFLSLIAAGKTAAFDIPEIIALATSCLILIGVLRIGEYFRGIRSAWDMLRESEKRYRTLAEAAQDMIFIVDRNDQVKYVNSFAAKQFGRQPQEIIGKKRSELFPAEISEIQMRNLQKVFETGEPLYIEGKTQFLDRKAWISTCLTPIADEEGKVISIMGISRDITERRKAEEKLRESEEKYRLLFQNTPIGIFNYDSQLHITDCNDIFVDILQSSREKIIGLDMKTLNDRNVMTAIRKAVEGGKGLYEGFYRATTGPAEIWVSMRTAPVFDRDGSVKGGVGIVEDVTERKKMEDEILLSKYDWENTFNTITDIITVHDKDFNIIRANKSAEKILGLPLLEKTPDSKCFKYYHGMGKPPEGCPSCQCLQTGIPATFELFEPHLNMFIEIRAIPRFDATHNLIGLIHVVRDITERKRSEEKISKLLSDLSRAKMEWEATFDTATEFIILINKDLDIIRCNKRFADYLGIPIRDMIGKKYYDYLPFEPEQLEYLKSKIQREEATEWLEEKTKEGFWFYASLHPVFSEKGKFLHSVIIATDITTLKDSQERLIKSEEELEDLFIKTVVAMVNALDAKSPWTKGHTERVTNYALEIGKEIGLDNNTLDTLRLCCLLHDIGKIGIYDTVLDKPGKLTDEEFELVKKHPEKGAEILSPIKQLNKIIPGIRHHHERYDGGGYPDGLMGEDIPLYARILHVADSFDSMTADRPYRPAQGAEYAVSELKKYAALKYDPIVVNTFLKILESRGRSKPSVKLN